MNRQEKSKNVTFKLTLLGTGTCVPIKNRNSSGYFLKTQNLNILIDCGAGTLRRLTEAKIDYRNIDLICVTHFHPDHCSDIAPFFLATRHTPGFTRSKTLTVIGPAGLKSHLKRLAELYGSWLLDSDYPLVVHELKENSLIIKTIRIFSAPMKHTDNSIGFRFEENKKSITFSGDTDFIPSLIQLAKKTDLLLIECSFPNNQKTEGHLTPKEVGIIANKSMSKKIILTHLYPVFKDDPVNEVKKIFNGEVIEGQDLMTLQI